MRRLVEKTASWGMDGAMCGMMNILQWRRRADSCTRKELAAFWVRSAISSVLIEPCPASALLSACWLTSTR